MRTNLFARRNGPLGALLAALLSACSSTSKDALSTELAALPKNRAIAEVGIERATLRMQVDGEQRELEFLYHHAPARAPREGALPIVLIHGTPSTLYAWTEVTYGTADFDGFALDRDVYAIEVIGHGMAPGDLAPYDFDRCAAFVVAALEALDLQRVHMAGSSYGGEFVWRAGLMAPERFASLTLLDSSGYPRREEDWLSEEVEMRENGLADYGWILNSRKRIDAALAPHFEVVPPDRVDEFYLVCGNAHNWEAMIDLARDENGTRAGEIPDLAMPVLLLWGADDLAYPPAVYAERFHADIPRSELVVLEQTGHYPHEERPARTVAEMRAFFTRVEDER